MATAGKPTAKNSQGTKRGYSKDMKAYRAGKRAAASGSVNERRLVADKTYRRGVKGKSSGWLKRTG